MRSKSLTSHRTTNYVRRSFVESLETRRVLTSFSFVAHDIPLPEFPGFVSHLTALDMDQDGDQDIAYHTEEGTVWHENIEGSLSTERRINASLNLIEERPNVERAFSSMQAFDLEGDGDLDYLGYVETDSELFVYENDGRGNFIESIVESAAQLGWLSEVKAFDQDEDGDLDLVFLARNDWASLWWMENLDGGEFQAPTLLEERVLPVLGPRRTELVDVDRDGDIDVLCNCQLEPNSHVWFIENTSDGFSRHDLNVRTSNLRVGGKIAAFDWDLDGDLEVFSINGGELNVLDDAGEGTYELSHTIELPFAGAREFSFAELDGDGLPDLIVNSLSQVVYFNQLEQPQSLLPPNLGVFFECGGDLVVDDINADGSQDVLIPTASSIAWSENGEATFESLARLPNGCGFRGSFAAGDIDSDGDTDLVSSFWGEVLVHKNTDGIFANNTASFSEQIGPVLFADFDNDGNLDLLTPFEASYAIILNDDGGGNYSSVPIILTDLFDIPLSFDHADVDGDGDQDILVLDEYLVYWLENEDNGKAWKTDWIDLEFVVTESTDTFEWLASFADLDHDGDEDVALLQEGRLEWFENDGGGIFGEPRIVDTTGIGQLNTFLGNRLAIADLDVDGELDLITSRIVDGLAEVVWYENDSIGGFSEAQQTGILDGRLHVSAKDMDGDGDVDIIAKSGGYRWYENRLSGDVDDDGQVSFADFLVVSQNFGKQADAVWEEGDLNGDGQVSFADFLILSANFGKTR